MAILEYTADVSCEANTRRGPEQIKYHKTQYVERVLLTPPGILGYALECPMRRMGSSATEFTPCILPIPACKPGKWWEL